MWKFQNSTVNVIRNFVLFCLVLLHFSCSSENDEINYDCDCETVEVYFPEGETPEERLVPIRIRPCEIYPDLTVEQYLEEFRDFPYSLALEHSKKQGCSN